MPPPNPTGRDDVWRLPADVYREVTTLHAHQSLVRFVIFIGLYGLSAWGAVTVWTALADPWSWLACLPLCLLAAASLHGISLFTHEGVHGVLSRFGPLNALLSVLCAMPVLQSFHAYRVLHLRHHAALGLADDPDHYDNYTPRKPLVFLMYWGRLLGGYPAYITLIPLLGWLRGTWRDRIAITLEGILLVSVVGWLLTALPFQVLLIGWAVPMVFIHFMVNVRGMSQHCGLPEAADPIRGSRTFLSPRLVTFFMCNETFHLEHHLYPQVPWYHLPRVHQALRPTLEAQGACYTPGYLAFVVDFVMASVLNRPYGSVHVERA